MTDNWPDDYASAVFLGRAFQEVGVAMYGPEWTGEESDAREHSPLSRSGGRWSTMDLHRAHVLLDRYRPDRGLPPAPSVAISRAPPPISTVGDRSLNAGRSPPRTEPFTPTDEDMDEASSVITELNAALAPAIERRRAVTAEIIRVCEAGELRTAYRRRDTGQLCRVPVEWWRGPRAADRFDTYTIDFKNPFKRLYYVSESVSWLYVERESLAAFIRPKQFNKRTMAEIEHQRAAAELAFRLAREVQWGLAETILWIGVRDLDEVAAPLVHWSQWSDMQQSGSLVAMARTYLSAHASEGRPVQARHPDEDLLAALRRGDIQATGLFRGEGSRATIPALEWYDLALSDGPSAIAGGQAGAFSPRTTAGTSTVSGPYWTRLLFPRAELQRVFPGDADPPREPLSSSAEAWRVGPAELQKAWIFRTAVIEEADRRRTRKSGRARDEAMERMAAECGRTWTADAIGAARRKGREKTPR